MHTASGLTVGAGVMLVIALGCGGIADIGGRAFAADGPRFPSFTPAPPPVAPKATKQSCDPKEEGAWLLVRNSDDPALLQEFLKQYPRGCHAKDPKFSAGSGGAAAAPTVVRACDASEEVAWSNIARSNEPGAFEAFLKSYPKGCHAQEARDTADGLKARADEARERQKLASCPANMGNGDAQWMGTCVGRLPPEVARAVQQARDAENRAKQQAAAGRDAQQRAMKAAAAARDVERLARAPDHPADLAVEDFTAQGSGVYAGAVTSGVRQGNGVWVMKNERYEGEWSNDVRNGVGRTVPASGPTFEGTWKEGNPCGVGVLTWPNGDRYEGDYCNGHYSGYGIFYFSTASNQNFVRQNVGQWANDRQTGYGVRLWASQLRSEGQWLDGKLNGYAAEFAADGQIQTTNNVPQQGLYDSGALRKAIAAP